MTSSWGEGTATTNGTVTVEGKVAYRYVKKLILSQKLLKSEKESLACILAPDHGKLIIEDGALKSGRFQTSSA